MQDFLYEQDYKDKFRRDYFYLKMLYYDRNYLERVVSEQLYDSKRTYYLLFKFHLFLYSLFLNKEISLDTFNEYVNILFKNQNYVNFYEKRKKRRGKYGIRLEG